LCATTNDDEAPSQIDNDNEATAKGDVDDDDDDDDVFAKLAELSLTPKLAQSARSTPSKISTLENTNTSSPLTIDNSNSGSTHNDDDITRSEDDDALEREKLTFLEQMSTPPVKAPVAAVVADDSPTIDVNDEKLSFLQRIADEHSTPKQQRQQYQRHQQSISNSLASSAPLLANHNDVVDDNHDDDDDDDDDETSSRQI
jgi:hypothetical protein